MRIRPSGTHRPDPPNGGRVDAASADAADLALDAARRGDQEGFRVLWRALQPRLLRYLQVRGALSPEDVASETWLQVVRDLDTFTGDAADFRAWVFTLARHRDIDAARSRARRPATAVPDMTLVPAPATPSAESVVMENTATATALALVATLPEEQAEMVMLRVVADLDVATVAAVVGKSPGAVRVAVHRGLRALADHPQLSPATTTGKEGL